MQELIKQIPSREETSGVEEIQEMKFWHPRNTYQRGEKGNCVEVDSFISKPEANV